MTTLALKIPPPVIALGCAAGMYFLAENTLLYGLGPLWTLPAAIGLALIGIGFDLAGVLAFRRHRTTINPLHPENTRHLVTGGVYRISRNPMYVGMAILLLAWTVYLESPAALLGLVAFIAYITRFQIIPEESLLAQHFGADFEAYRQRVRRWL
ncbi:isoprenylcysteine carboxylmethyltransferase family protein [Arenimonas sp. GDDSR-1]|uniref:methyltransferase family protein n=1 Tax=Arenimonas sp. GDDSR-1 TaxID=2950125 RepID=UPI0026206AE0|nr:isoprenylcysteine carboxylmethyltransferase family protein [Arenimonas sp. GDDSR-1]